MKVSIITASIRGELLDKVWESIKNQTYKKWEWIIINNNSQSVRDWWEKNKDIVKKENPNIWIVHLPYNTGRFGLYSRNAGAIIAHNDDIVFLDDDNEWYKNHLQSLVELKQETGKIPFCWMHVKGKKEGSDVDRIKKTGFAKQGIDLGCLLWDRKLFEQYGFFRNDSQVTYDWNCIARVYFGYGPHNFICTDKPTLIFWHKRY